MSMVTLKIYDVLGREVAVLVHQVQNAGAYSVAFPVDKIQTVIPSGIYFYRLTAGLNSETRKMILLK